MKKLVLIAGGTASGKTTIADLLVRKNLEKNITSTIVSIDNYYKSIDMLNVDDGKNVNWDDPKTINWNLLKKDINFLLNGKTIFKKSYDFNHYKHLGKEIEYKSNDLIILEGLFALYDEDLKEISSSKIYVNCDSDIRLIRRIRRDIKGRSNDSKEMEFFIQRWEKEIKPMHKKYINPTKEFADLTVKNNYDLFSEKNDEMMNNLIGIMVELDKKREI